MLNDCRWNECNKGRGVETNARHQRVDVVSPPVREDTALEPSQLNGCEVWQEFVWVREGRKWRVSVKSIEVMLVEWACAQREM